MNLPLRYVAIILAILAGMIVLSNYTTLPSLEEHGRLLSVTERRGYVEQSADAPPIFYTDEQMQKWYDGGNDEYFDGKLPSNVHVRFGDLKKLQDMGIYFSSLNEIDLDDEYQNNFKISMMTEYHEMCHVALRNTPDPTDLDNDGHGQNFQRCMTRLAEAGAFKDLW